MVFKATFNTISVISWRSVLLVEETRVPRENHRPLTSHKHYHMMSYRVHLSEKVPYDIEIELCNMIL
jgi:hypothetical protein